MCIRDSNINQNYLKEIHAYHETLSYHYQFGSNYNTLFWKKIKEQSEKFLSFNANFLNLDSFEDAVNLYIQTEGREDYSWIGQYPHPAPHDLFVGMNNLEINPNNLQK